MAISDPGGANVHKEHSKTECPMVTADVKGRRSMGVGARAMGQGGVEHSEA